MRKSVFILALGVAISAGLLHAQTAVTGKVSTQWNCAAPNPMHAVPVGDSADHAYIVQQSKCTAAKGEIAGVKDKDGVATEFAEGMGANVKGHGIFVATAASGDKIVYSYTFTGATKDKMNTGSNKWTMTSGTGKFKGITGSGTCTGKGPEGGSAIYDCVGTYTLGK